MQTIEGTLVAPSNARFALVAARFNDLVVKELIAGARDVLLRHGIPEDHLTLVRVPGAWEIPAACRRLASSKRFEAVIALGAVIRGGTPHFDYVAGGVASGIASVSADTGIPVAFGVLTTDSIEQAIERSGTKAGNKGVDAALAALEMVSLGRNLTDAGY
jgi:6,7-dimethyl-8-ribityllumazine synthase